MLLELSIKDFAIIDEMRVAFAPGLNALTGETGAGKSIVIDALGAVLGERVGADVVRTGAKLARVEASFEIDGLADHAGLAAALVDIGAEPDDGVLILSREIAAGGRSSARINGRAATAGMLTRVGEHLVDIHGQSEHLSLLRPAEHLDILDRFAGLLPDRDAVSALVDELRAVRSRIADIVSNAREREQRADLLRFQVEEIDAAGPRDGEEEELSAERAVLANTERLALDANAALSLLTGDDDLVEDAVLPALTAMRQATGHLADVAAVDGSMRSVASRAEELVYLLEDIAAETRAYRDRVEADPARLLMVEDRLAELKRLTRKYGATIVEVLAFRDEAANELEAMTGGAASVDLLRERESRLLGELGRRATALSEARRAGGEALAEAVERVIAELNMGRSRFAVGIVQVPDAEGPVVRGTDGVEQRVAVDATGADRVAFLIAPNAGEALKPLARVASGGETARLMLALKSILSAADATPTLVFDEVDVGVGGRSGQVVGEKLWGLSHAHQVLVITHLPQIAAFADAHYRIVKAEKDGRTVSRVDAIADDERVDELAAMIDGLPATAAARTNAREMLARVEAWKVEAGGAEAVLAQG